MARLSLAHSLLYVLPQREAPYLPSVQHRVFASLSDSFSHRGKTLFWCHEPAQWSRVSPITKLGRAASIKKLCGRSYSRR